MGRRRAQFPDLFTEHPVGDPWVKPQPGVVRVLLQQFTGPNCIGGVSVDYRRIKIHPLVRNTWPRVKATPSPADRNPTISPMLRRTWRTAACIGVAMSAVAELEHAYGAENIRHGVARITRAGDTVAGLLPVHAPFGNYAPYGEEDDELDARYRTLLYRTGRFYEVATPTLYVEPERRLFIPVKPSVLAENVPIDRVTMWTYTNNTPIV
jgi:hypothetical protein